MRAEHLAPALEMLGLDLGADLLGGAAGADAHALCFAVLAARIRRESAPSASVPELSHQRSRSEVVELRPANELHGELATRGALEETAGVMRDSSGMEPLGKAIADLFGAEIAAHWMWKRLALPKRSHSRGPTVSTMGVSSWALARVVSICLTRSRELATSGSDSATRCESSATSL